MSALWSRPVWELDAVDIPLDYLAEADEWFAKRRDLQAAALVCKYLMRCHFGDDVSIASILGLDPVEPVWNTPEQNAVNATR